MDCSSDWGVEFVIIQPCAWSSLSCAGFSRFRCGGHLARGVWRSQVIATPILVHNFETLVHFRVRHFVVTYVQKTLWSTVAVSLRCASGLEEESAKRATSVFFLRKCTDRHSRCQIHLRSCAVDVGLRLVTVAGGQMSWHGKKLGRRGLGARVRVSASLDAWVSSAAWEIVRGSFGDTDILDMQPRVRGRAQG